MARNIIGISAHYHDSACCVLQDGRLVAAAQEERFTRVKHDAVMPAHAFRNCLAQAGLRISDIDHLAYYEDPGKKLERQLWMILQQDTVDPSALLVLDGRAPLREIRNLLGYEGPVSIVEHHRSHAAAAYYYSGFDQAAILTVDGVGEWLTTAFWEGRGPELRFLGGIEFPHSIGLLYSTITAYLGFEVNDGEYKVMGLAPYGQPSLVEQVRKLIKRWQGGEFELDLDYFDFVGGSRMYSAKLHELFGHPPVTASPEPDEFSKDLARSMQFVLEEILLEKVNYVYRQVPSANLCLAGGVALNCVANARIRLAGPFRNLFVQPAAGDAGSALGAAAEVHARLTGNCCEPLSHVFLGPMFTGESVQRLLRDCPTRVRQFQCENELLEATARFLASGQVVGWFHGRMEFGPRALGARSILADPRQPGMQQRINSLVKRREPFRPFAPAVLEERAAEHFELDRSLPFMLETCRVISPLKLPAITHVDGSARVQMVSARFCPRFHRLLRKFEEITDCPILLNTSFNLRGEPIVCSPVDALLTFVRSELDILVLEDSLLTRSDLPPKWLDWFPAMADSGRAGASSVYTFL